MSLKTEDIRSFKLSLRGLNTIDEVEPPKVVETLTEEDIIYNEFIKLNPLVEELIERLGLVNTITENKFKKHTINE